MGELERTLLVQRATSNLNKENPKTHDFSFGGGLRHGGVEPELMKKLNEVVDFEYMGATEFEFGVLRESLNTIIRNYDKYITSNVYIKGKIIYVIGEAENIEKINQRIHDLSEDNSQIYPREKTYLNKIVNQTEQENENDTCCWFELDNNFIFTTIPLIHYKLMNIFLGEWEKENKSLSWIDKIKDFLNINE